MVLGGSSWATGTSQGLWCRPPPGVEIGCANFSCGLVPLKGENIGSVTAWQWGRSHGYLRGLRGKVSWPGVATFPSAKVRNFSLSVDSEAGHAHTSGADTRRLESQGDLDY